MTRPDIMKWPDSPVSVGACGDPSLIQSAKGGTVSDPCPRGGLFGIGSSDWAKSMMGGPISSGCHRVDALSWVDSASYLTELISIEWNRLMAVEATKSGAGTKQLELQGVVKAVMDQYDALPSRSDFSSWNYDHNGTLVAQYVAWMQSAACVLQRIQRALRQYGEKPSPSITPSGGGANGYVPPSKTPTQRIGETAIMVAAAAGVAYFAYRFFTGRGSSAPRIRTQLPPRR